MYRKKSAGIKCTKNCLEVLGMSAKINLHMELPKGKGLQIVMSLLLLFLCAGCFTFHERWRESSSGDSIETGLTETVQTDTIVRTEENLSEEQAGEQDQKEIIKGNWHVVLDAGHGATDSGKIGINGALEKDINLAIVKDLQELLSQKGVSVTLTREDDSPLYEEAASNKKMSDMKNRIKTIESSQAQAVISIHQNSYPDQSVRGPQVFYYTSSTEGERLANAIQSRFTDLIGDQNRRQIKANKDYYLLIHTPVPTVIVECGFLSNSEEAEKLITEEYQHGVAQVIADGIIDWLSGKE